MWPTSTELVSEVVKLCDEHVIPVIPFGTGTGFEGGVTAGMVGTRMLVFFKINHAKKTK